MKSGFTFELYEMIFKNCFIHSSNYKNGNLQLSLFGTDPETNETAHFADISLEQNRRKLKDDEVIVDYMFKPTLIPQLKNLGILKNRQVYMLINLLSIQFIRLIILKFKRKNIVCKS